MGTALARLCPPYSALSTCRRENRNAGIAGGSDAFLNQRFAFLAGGERVYVYTGRRLDYSKWIEGLRHGRSFATVGPLLEFLVNEQLPGAEQRVPAGGATVTNNVAVTVSGTATDGGGVVAGVEVSTDGGQTWHPATGFTPGCT